MIPAGVQVFLVLDSVDLRCGFDRLAAVAQERLGDDARGGALFVFTGKRRTTAKILFFDGSGLCVFHKRLDAGTFGLPAAPAPDATHVEVDDATLAAWLDGLPIAPAARALRAPRRRVH